MQAGTSVMKINPVVAVLIGLALLYIIAWLDEWTNRVKKKLDKKSKRDESVAIWKCEVCNQDRDIVSRTDDMFDKINEF